jgi:hypothetical protein
MLVEPIPVIAEFMNEDHDLRNFEGASPDDIEDALERSEVVFFERCPLQVPSDEDLAFLRDELPAQIKAKNVSYHPETDSVPRLEAPDEMVERVTAILKAHLQSVTDFLTATIPDLVPGWKIGTCSFRPCEERGRDLKPHASNELVHIDAGAYGATNGARILRFFVNVNPTVSRIWGTKGGFADLVANHGELLEAARGSKSKIRLQKNLADRAFSSLVKGLSKVNPLATVVDSSPYDRAMRRIHNYMKDSENFRNDLSDYRQLSFPPFSAWMVLTDGISHSVVSGQHCFVTTALIPMENCRISELVPYNILEKAS